MQVFTIEKIGPFCAKDAEGKILGFGTKAEVSKEVNALAAEVAANGEDAQVQELDTQGRVLRLLPFYVNVAREEDDVDG